MIRNIILAVLALAIVYVGWQTYGAYKNRRALADVPAEFVYGPEDADLSVVEFLDYSCGYCRQAHPVIKEAIERDGKIRYVPRAVAFLGEDSAMAATVLYAAAQQGKLWEMHDALMNTPMPLDNQTVRSLAESLGLDADKLLQDTETREIRRIVIDNMDLLTDIGGRATPTFVIGGKMMYVPEVRMPTAEDFLEMFAEARSR